MIKASQIHKSFANIKVLKGIDLHIQTSEVVAIVGASGAGKSTLLQIIGTLEQIQFPCLILILLISVRYANA